MNYVWSYWQSVTYHWKGWVWQLWGAKPRWYNPTCDVPSGVRHLNTELAAGETVKIDWPDELKDKSIGLGPVGQVPWDGTVGGGKPVQMVFKGNLKGFKVDNPWGGMRVKDGELERWYKPGERYDVNVPSPIRNGWAVEGYPNGKNTGDRHWYGVEEDGTAHEVIWLGIGTNTVSAYSKYDPEGNLVDGLVNLNKDGSYEPRGVVKGHQQWTSIAWNVGDPRHRLGIVFKSLGRNAETGEGDSPEPYGSWEYPAYGQLYRLSEEEYQRQLTYDPNDEQRILLDSLRYYGVEPYDQGGSSWHGSIGMVSGAQHRMSTIHELDIPLSELELVVEDS